MEEHSARCLTIGFHLAINEIAHIVSSKRRGDSGAVSWSGTAEVAVVCRSGEEVSLRKPLTRGSALTVTGAVIHSIRPGIRQYNHGQMR